jgi:hypothetical protein
LERGCIQELATKIEMKVEVILAQEDSVYAFDHDDDRETGDGKAAKPWREEPRVG